MIDKKADFTPKNFKPLQTLSPFIRHVLQSFPFIEKDFDAFTDYQLLCKVIEYLNKVTENNNNMSADVVDLYNAYVSLQEYVNKYFESMEVVNFETLEDDATHTTYRITFYNDFYFDMVVKHGKGIKTFEKTNTSGLLDTYTITYTDDTKDTFIVKNGEKGEKGDALTFDMLTFEQKQELKGEKGDANVLSIGTVTAGDTANATITGDSPNQKLNLVLPRGEKGDALTFEMLTPEQKEELKGKDGKDGKDGVIAEAIKIFYDSEHDEDYNDGKSFAESIMTRKIDDDIMNYDVIEVVLRRGMYENKILRIPRETGVNKEFDINTTMEYIQDRLNENTNYGNKISIEYTRLSAKIISTTEGYSETGTYLLVNKNGYIENYELQGGRILAEYNETGIEPKYPITIDKIYGIKYVNMDEIVKDTN